MRKIELLAPAGNKDKLETAFYFGADAIYFAGKQYGLRAFSENFELDELKNYVDYAHKMDKKAYITVNILAHNSDFVGLSDYLSFLQEIKVDALIISDPGILRYALKYAPNVEIHLSTQANCTNFESAKFWVDNGVKRLILARELSLTEISEIREHIDDNIELETFVHGAMCISYSGRCLLSNYLAGRDSNRGACVQACRWEYTICEKSRQNDKYEIQQDEKGTYILNSKDLNMLEHLDKIVKAGVTSLKIEGRMKTTYYVANVVNAYRRALNILLKGGEYKIDENLKAELLKCSHRKYTTGFYLGANDKENIESSAPVSSYEFIANVVESNDGENGFAKVEQRNRFKVGDKLEILSPSENFNKEFIVNKMTDEKGNDLIDALKVQQIINLECPFKLYKGDCLRIKKEIESE